MIYIISIFAGAMLLLGTVMLVNPNAVIERFRKYSSSTALHVTAVVIRLVLGTALITYAPESKYPIALEVFGWMAVTAAIIFAAMGRNRFKMLISWVLGFASSFMRFAGLMGILLGGFLVFALS